MTAAVNPWLVGALVIVACVTHIAYLAIRAAPGDLDRDHERILDDYEVMMRPADEEEP